MNHTASGRFWRCYGALPADVRDLADKNFRLLKADPKHPSLHFKPVGRYWSARVSREVRVLGIRQNDVMIWFFIGVHDDYEGRI